MQVPTEVIIPVLTAMIGLIAGAFHFLLKDRERLLSEIAASNTAKDSALSTAAELGKKAPELLMEVQRLNQRLAELQRG